jgi:hypothetical protein
MRLDQFEREGCPLKIRVPWLAEPLWFVPGNEDVALLVADGVSRGRIWTARELRDLLHIRNVAPKPVQTIARAKAELGGELIEVRASHD